MRASLERSTGHAMADSVRALEARAIHDAIERNDGNRLAAARELGMHKSTFFRKVRSLGVQLPSGDGRAPQRRAKR